MAGIAIGVAAGARLDGGFARFGLDRLVGRRGCRRRRQPLGQPGDERAQRLARRQLLDDRVGVATRRAQAEPLGELADDLDALDRVDRQVGLEVEVEPERLGGIAGALADDRHDELERIDGRGRPRGHARHGCRDDDRHERRDVDHLADLEPRRGDWAPSLVARSPARCRDTRASRRAARRSSPACCGGTRRRRWSTRRRRRRARSRTGSARTLDRTTSADHPAWQRRS